MTIAEGATYLFYIQVPRYHQLRITRDTKVLTASSLSRLAKSALTDPSHAKRTAHPALDGSWREMPHCPVRLLPA